MQSNGAKLTVIIPPTEVFIQNIEVADEALCVTSAANPPAKLQVFVGDEIVDIDDTQHDVRLSSGGWRSSISLSGVMTKENHGKLISCQAEHLDSSTSLSSSSAKLNIPFAPDILQVTADREYYHVNNTAVLQCQVYSNPAAMVIWRHVLTQKVFSTSNDGTLMIADLNENSIGDYECIAENKLGRVTSTPVHIQLAHAPIMAPNNELNKTQKNRTVISGDNINLQCEAEAVPQASFRWLHKKSSGKGYLGMISPPDSMG